MKNDNRSKDQTKSQDPKRESAWKGSSPEDVTGKQPNPNKAMGNAANRPQNQGQTNKSAQNRMKEDDADEMGSGKRQDDN
jgi:hypothetical protein